MSKNDPQPTKHTDDLEEVKVKPRAHRGAVVSVRLDSAEAQLLAATAERLGMSVSEFARSALRSAIASHWRLRVWSDSQLIVGAPPETGGKFGRLLWPEGVEAVGHGRVIWHIAGGRQVRSEGAGVS